MQLTRVELAQFRQFRTGLRIDGLEPGLNVFYGPNESGKSTLAQAIRAAFFERHTSGTLRHLQPWGDTGAAPQVSVAFTANAREHVVTKRFLQQRRCDVLVDGARLSGDEAEHYLADLLGFSLPLKGASQPRNQGIPGLLWMEQGMAQDLGQPLQHASERLQDVLNDAMGEVASSDGDAVLKKVEERLLQLLTPATAAPTRDYKKALDQLAELQTQRDETDALIAAYRQEVDALMAMEAEHARAEARPPWTALRAKADAATRELEQIRALQEEQRHAREALDMCRQTRTLLQDQLRAAADHEQALRQRQDALVLASEAFDALQARTPVLAQQAQDARALADRAREHLQQSQLRQDELARRQDAQRLQREHQASAERLRQATRLQEELEALHERVAGLTIDSGTLERLCRAEEALRTLEMREQAIAPHMELDLEEGQSVSLDGAAVSGRTTHRITRAATLRIPHIGTLRIIPGGDDLAEIARRRSVLQAERDAHLRALNVDGAEQAREREREAAGLQERIRNSQAMLDLVAPEGLVELRAAIKALSSRLGEQGADNGPLSPDAGSADPATGTGPDGPSQATPIGPSLDAPARCDPDEPSNVAAAMQAWQHAQEAVHAHEEALHAHHTAVARAQDALAAAQRERDHARRASQDPERRKAHEHTLQRLEAERVREAELTQSMERRQSRIDASQPELLAQDAERYGRSAAHEERLHTDRAHGLRELRGRLQAQGAQGLEETRALLDGRLQAAKRRVDELRRTAAALQLLQRLLTEQRQALTSRLQAPLAARLHHYAGILFDSAEPVRLAIDDDLAPATLMRSDSSGPVNELSFGAREQLGTISRLAYADLLKEAGRPTLIMLDDALVHSDADRLARMKRVLFDASQRHQILLFTCDPDRWRDLGVALRPIRDSVLAAHARP